jgi:hypothetical protein
MLLTKEEQVLFAKRFCEETVDGFSPTREENTVTYSLDEIKWKFTVTRFGSLSIQIKESGKTISKSAYGLYPQYKSIGDSVSRWRQIVARKMNLDYRK